MKESSELPTQLEDEANYIQELLAEGRQKLNAFRNSTPNFGIQEMASTQDPSPTTKSNPFAILGEDIAGAVTLMEMQEDMKEGWSFQGRKRHDPKQPHLGRPHSNSPRTPPTEKSPQEGREVSYTPRSTPPTLPPSAYRSRPARNHSEPGSGRSSPGPKRKKKKHLFTAEISPCQTFPSVSESQAQQKQLKQNGHKKPQGPTSSSA